MAETCHTNAALTNEMSETQKARSKNKQTKQKFHHVSSQQENTN